MATQCEPLRQLALDCGATNAACLSGEAVVLSESFRPICASNACGMYGKCYMCPPDVGDIHALMAKVRAYGCAVLYQSVHALEDSYDYEGMVDARVKHGKLTQALERKLRERGARDHLHLSVGGCMLCETCAKQTDEPCRHPDWALPSLESCGVDVYNTAQNAGLKYINGQDTVTYFGMVLWNEG